MERQSSKQAKTKSIAAEETAAEALAEIAAGEPKSSHLGGTNMPNV